MVRFAVCVVIVLALLAALPGVAALAGTAITYQGKLTDSAGVPLTGSYDMSLKLYDALTAGNQVGSTVTLSGVSVAAGLFTVSLDFGAAAFSTSSDRWLETTVGTTTLAPRVKLTPVPSAIYAQTVPWSGVTGAPTSLPPSGTAGGDLTGTYPNPAVASSTISSGKLASDSASLSKVTNGVAQVDSVGLRIGPAATSPILMPQLFGVYSPTIQPDQVQTEGGDALTGTEVWQSFTAGVASSLSAVCCFVYSGQPWTKTMTIYSGTGTSGTVLASQVVRGDETAPDGSIQIYSLENPVQLTAGQVYTFSIHGGTQVISLDGKSGNPYAGGSSSVANYDAMFYTFFEAGEPIPALVVDRFNGRVGIGTDHPGETLDVAGTVKLDDFYMESGASQGYVLTSNAYGDGNWQALPAMPTNLPPSGAAGGDLTGTYPNPTIGANTINSTKIIDGSVTSADIADDTVVLADLASNSVDSSKLVNDSVATADLLSAEGSLAKVSGGNVVSTSGRIGVHTAAPAAALHVSGFTGIDQSSPYDWRDGTYYNQANVWQSFTPATNGNLVSVAAILGATSASALNLAIYQGEGTGGSLLTQQSVTIADTGLTWRTFDLATPVHMLSGQKYTFYVGGGPLLNVRVSDDNRNAGGTYKGSTTADMNFTTTVASDAFMADGLASVTGLRIGSSATSGHVLTSDALGWGTWQAFPTSLPPSGAAGGDLTGTYPNPTVATSAITSAKILDGTVAATDLASDATSLNKVTAGAASVSSGNIGIGVTPTAKLDVAGTAKMTGFQLGTSATAGQVLTTNASGAGTWQALPSSLPPSGAAGGDLTGSYPNPTIATSAVTSVKIADGTVALADHAANSVDSSKVVDSSIAAADLANDAASLARVSGGTAAVSGGNIGIGTTSPTAKLDVAGTAKMTGFHLGTTATSGQVLTTDVTGVGTWQALPTSLPPSGSAGGDLTGTYPNPTVGTGKIDSSKIVDGTVALVDLATSSVNSAKILDASIALVDMASGSVDSSKIVDSSVALADHAANSVDSTKIVDGSVALADHAANSVDSSKLVDSSVASVDLTSDAASLNKVSGGAMTASSGSVGIGTTTPSFTLHINGTVGITSLPQADKRNVQWDPTTGQLYQAVSSRRYKDNITPLVDDFQKFLLAEPRTYTYKSNPGHWDIGYIAEDIDELGLKTLVHYNEAGQPDALKYEKMVIYLNEIAKDQRTKISDLQSRDAQKDAQIADLQKQIDELKTLVAAQARETN